jgi:hypothetical protein
MGKQAMINDPPTLRSVLSDRYISVRGRWVTKMRSPIGQRRP